MTQEDERTARRFRVDVASLPEFEELVAEIYVDDHFIGLLSQESGPDYTLFEIEQTKGSAPVKVELTTFEAALAHAKARLKRLEKRWPPDDV